MDQETKDALVVFAPVIIFIVIIGLLIFFENTEMDFNLDSFFIDATADAGVYGEITADS